MMALSKIAIFGTQHTVQPYCTPYKINALCGLNEIVLLLTMIEVFVSLSGLPERPNSPIEPKKEGESSSMYSSLPTSDAPGSGRQMQVYLHFSELEFL